MALPITQIDALNTPVDGTRFSSVKLEDGYYAAAYRGTDDDGFITTYSYDGDFDNITAISTLEHETSVQQNAPCSLIKLDDTHLVLSYSGVDTDGFVKTFSINASHVVTQIDVLEFETNYLNDTKLVKIDDTHFACAYAGDGSDGFVSTFSVDGSFDNIAVIDTLEFETVRAWGIDMILYDTQHLIVGYTDNDSDSWLKSISFDSSYDNLTVESSIEPEYVYGEHTAIAKLSDGWIAYTISTASKGWMYAMKVTGYSISKYAGAVITIVAISNTSLVAIDSTHAILAYSGSSNDGYITTFFFDPDDNYRPAIESDLEYDTSLGYYNSLIELGSDDTPKTYYALSYQGKVLAVTNGINKTFSIPYQAPQPSTDNGAPFMLLV